MFDMLSTRTTSLSLSGSLQSKRALSNFTSISSCAPSIFGLGTCRVSMGGMAAARGLNCRSPLGGDILIVLRKGHVFDKSPGTGGGNSTGGGDTSGGGGDGVLRPILNFEQVMNEAKGVSLPLDMLKSAKTTGIPTLFLHRYLSMQGLGWGLGFAMRSSTTFRNLMMIDPSYLLGLGKKFASSVLLLVVNGNFMAVLGKESLEILICLSFLLVFKIVVEGYIEPHRYARGISKRLTSTTKANGYSIFEAERCESLVEATFGCATAYRYALIIFAVLLLRLLCG